MVLKIKSLREMLAGRGVKIALYGDSGVGKTTQIAALLQMVPDDRKLMVITAEHGLLSLAEHIDLDDPRVAGAEVTTIGEVREAVAFAKNTANCVDWVVIDSVSNIADRELRARLEAGEKDPRRAYGDVQAKTPTMLWEIVDVAHLNALFIFHDFAEKREEGNGKDKDVVYHYSPSVPSAALKAAMPFIFDAVLHMEMTGAGKRQIRTAKTRNIMAKDRSGRLDAMEGDDMSVIVTKIRKGLAAIDCNKEQVTT